MEFYITLNPDTVPFDKTLQQIKTQLIEDYPYDNNNLSFVLCREVATREHFHLYLKDSVKVCPPGKPGDPIRTRLRRYIREVFPGEIRFSSKQVEDSIRCIAYTIKDGNYITHRIDWLVFLKAKSISKPKSKTYKDCITEFYQSVGSKSEDTLVSEVIDLHDKFDLMIDPQRIAKIVRLAKIKQKDSGYRQRLIERIVMDI